MNHIYGVNKYTYARYCTETDIFLKTTRAGSGSGFGGEISGSGSGKKVRIRPDPDPQHCFSNAYSGQFLSTTNSPVRYRYSREKARYLNGGELSGRLRRHCTLNNGVQAGGGQVLASALLLVRSVLCQRHIPSLLQGVVPLCFADFHRDFVTSSAHFLDKKKVNFVNIFPSNVSEENF
jgi:hypothetical protein